MSITRLYSQYRGQSNYASGSHSDYDDHDDGSDHNDEGWHDDNYSEGDHVDYNEKYTERYENHSDHNDHGVHTSISEVRYQPKENSGYTYINYDGDFAFNFVADGEIFSRAIFQGEFESNLHGGDVKILDSDSEIIFEGAGTIILQDDGDFEVYEGEILSDTDEDNDGEDYDDEDYDDEDYGYEYYGDKNFAIDFLDNGETHARIIFQGEFEGNLQGGGIKILDSYGETLFQIKNISWSGGMNITDIYGENLFQIDAKNKTFLDSEGSVIFQGGGTIILQDDGNFQTFAGEILSDNYDEGHVDYYEGNDHDDHADHTDRYDHSDYGGHSDYDDYEDYNDYDDYSDTYSDWS